MTIEIGSHCTLEVLRETEHGLYLGGGESGLEVLLPGKHVPENAQIGDQLRVFVYTDSEDRPVATTQVPNAVVGDFAFLQVVDVTQHGAFLDWGLDKDLFAPKSEQVRRLEVGDALVFAVSLDERDERVKASSKLDDHLDREVAHLEAGTAVDLLVYDETPLGSLVVVAGAYSGMIYRNEAFRDLEIGQELSGYIKLVRPDGKLDISLQRVGPDAITDATGVVLAALRAGGGFLALHDKSPPAEIYAQLSLSKKAFKRALGGLYKARRVELREDGVKLIENG